ncbi:MAG: phosphoadenylyl-sulfate reductase [Candidatus Thermoplasmatota archaeon]|nr:phosphoadenylyl-sulfate reductase [Candidatus Thermoplasmatota archaeon]
MDPKFQESLNTIREGIEKYDKIAVGCSFGKDSIVMLHLALQVKPDIPVFAVMTPHKPKETFEYRDMLTKKWNLNIKTYMSDQKVPEGLWETDPDQCCQILKVEPTREAVKELDAWFAGLRSTEGRTRVDYKTWEQKGPLMKINPILNWTEADVWRYMAVNQIPAHPWYALGYRSIGCAPCSNIGGEQERDGRWKGTSKCGGECGIHTQQLKE